MKTMVFALCMGTMCVLAGVFCHPTPFVQFVLVACGSAIFFTACFGIYVEIKRKVREKKAFYASWAQHGINYQDYADSSR